MEKADRSNDPLAAGITWLQFSICRSPFRERWPSIRSLRVVTSMFDLPVSHSIPVTSLLEVGATSREWEPTVRRLWPNADYRSLDLDRTHQHDYHAFDEIDRQFDVVMCLEVLEHVAPDVAVEILRQCQLACQPGGHLLVSVPNVMTPGVQLEFTHQTAYNHHDLPALLSWVGLEIIDGARVCLAGRRYRLLHQYLVSPLHRLMKVDFCQSVIMLAKRPQENV